MNSYVVQITSGLLLAAWVLLTPLSDAKAQLSSWDLPEFREAVAASVRRDCRAAWDLIWPFARMGNHEARFFLFSETSFHTNPPGYHTQALRMFLTRHNLTLAAYGALAQVPPG